MLIMPKRYPTPTDKYLIVTDPWGGVPIHEPNFFNNVTAWFEIMFKPKYPGVRPSVIFYQWTVRLRNPAIKGVFVNKSNRIKTS